MGLVLFGVPCAINSAIHPYSDHEKVAMNVGFYYMANAGGRLTGTVLSGWLYQEYGLVGCLWCSSGFIVIAMLLSNALPHPAQTTAEPR